ncbi:MAG: stage V sporulation protein D [Fimbriimonadales bacterium]|nr:MAG: stage V sporulation protein D [Fimbriimonadales bacterium]
MTKPVPYNRYAVVRLKAEDLQRIRIASGLLAIGGATIVGRLVYLQGFQHTKLRKEGEARRYLDRPLLALRGAILDRYGKPLAQSEVRCRITIDPMSIRDVDAFARLLREHLGKDASHWKTRILQAQVHGERYMRVAIGAPLSRYEKLKKACRASFQHLKRDERPVVNREQMPARHYPQGSLAPQVLGLTQLVEDKKQGNRLVATSGIERSYNTRLAGANGIEQGERTPYGYLIPETVRQRIAPRDGSPVQLTLDTAIQQVAEHALDQLYRKHRPKGALILVLDPRTGDLLAIANRPTFDLVTREGLRAPRNDTQAERDQAMEPLRNRAVEFLYEPGSTVKPLVVAAMLESGVCKPASRYFCGGAYLVSKKRIKCSENKRHGAQTLEEVISHSCNVVMAQMGLRAGLEGVYHALQRFHLFEPMRAGFAYEEVGRTIPPDKVRWGRELRAANLAFGQGLLTTPLALVAAYGALANEGRWIAPRIVLDPPLKREPPQQIIAPEHARIVLQGLVRAVEEGTGKQAQVRGYWVAGKTGTAQKALEGGRGYAQGKYIASFVGMIPAENPRAVILVLADEPQNGYYGGEAAAPAFRQVAQFLMWYWRIPSARRESTRTPPPRNPRIG